ncbi:hypothetical protein [Priestia abyssalis]|uniref:hypothetical protein n=1 Tax=Priestia abyssalis TaxID=1221450 RepID=UPI0009950DD6|nr:hypothetical protein [Priestia abyssalis]
MEGTKVKRRTGKVKKQGEVNQDKQQPEETVKKRGGKVKKEPKEAPSTTKTPVKKGKQKKVKKKGNMLQSINFARTLRSIFLISIGLLIFYLYYLQTEGVLITGIQHIWSNYKQALFSILGFVAYSGLLFYMGFRKGRKK